MFGCVSVDYVEYILNKTLKSVIIIFHFMGQFLECSIVVTFLCCREPKPHLLGMTPIWFDGTLVAMKGAVPPPHHAPAIQFSAKQVASRRRLS